MSKKFLIGKTVEPLIVIAQINVESKNLKDNFARMSDAITNGLKKQANLIIFPEMVLPGYLNGDFWECTSFLKECEKYHKKIAVLSKHIDILFGSVGIDWKMKNEDGRVRKYNAAFFAHKGKLVQNKKTKFNFWPKTLLPQYREFDDSRYFFDLRKLAYEKKCLVEDLYEPMVTTYDKKKFKIGISICEDVWDEHYSLAPIDLFSKKFEHDVFVNISASPYTIGKNTKRDRIFSIYARKLNTTFIYANCVGTQNIGKSIFTFDGSSKVYSKDGNILLCGQFCQEENILFSFSSSFTKKSKQKINHAFEGPVSGKNSLHFSQVMQNILEYAIKNICKKWNISKVVIGVSGGIDSALSSVLFTRVLGSQNVYLVNMPTHFNADITKNAAQKLATHLNCPYAVFPIETIVNEKREQINHLIFNRVSSKLSPQVSPKMSPRVSSRGLTAGSKHSDNTESLRVHLKQLNFENIQARERSSGVLAAVASALGAVFTCNANKSELTVGYGTLYGDMAGFLCPIGDLWKHQIYDLARYYNEIIFKREIIPHEIFTLTPSAELSSKQDVRKGLGDPLIYAYHDYLFAAWVEQWDRKTNLDCVLAYQNKTIDKLLQLPKGTTKKLFPTKEKFENDLNRWWTLFQGMAAIKRVQAPPVIVVSRRAFGFDYRESI